MNSKSYGGTTNLPEIARGLARTISILALSAVLSAHYAPARTQDFDKGMAAYKRGQYKAAHAEFQPLAAAGNGDAQYRMGIIYTLGRGIDRDAEQAEHWFLKASKQGHTGALYSLGTINLQRSDLPQAIGYFKAAAADGHRSAQYNLGVMYARGHGVGKNDKTAFEWYALAAAKGHPNAQFNLGVFYRDGLGTDANGAKAVEWLTKSAKNGSVLAQKNLARIYALGNGVAKDLVRSYMWLEIAEPRAGRRRNPYNRHSSAESAQIASNVNSAKKILEEQLSPESIYRAKILASDWIQKFGGRRD